MRIRNHGMPTDSDLMRIALYQHKHDVDAAKARVARVKELERQYAPLVAGLADAVRTKTIAAINSKRSAT